MKNKTIHFRSKQMTLKGLELKNLLFTIAELKDNQSNFKFNYALMKNKQRLLKIFAEARKEFPMLEEMKEIDRKVNELNGKFEGKELEEQFKELFEANKEVINKQNDIEAKFNITDFEVDLFLIDSENVPDGLTVNQIEILDCIIREV